MKEDTFEKLRESMQDAQDRFLGYHRPIDMKKMAMWQDEEFYSNQLLPGEEITVNGMTYLKSEDVDMSDLLERCRKAKAEAIARQNDSEYQKRKMQEAEQRTRDWTARYKKFLLNREEMLSAQDECSTYFLEFRKGRYFDNDNITPEDSLFCYGGLWDDIDLNTLFKKGDKRFDFYGITEFDANQWWTITEAAHNQGGYWNEFAEELTPWVSECYSESDAFTIYGM